jgi:hypothetical protein
MIQRLYSESCREFPENFVGDLETLERQMASSMARQSKAQNSKSSSPLTCTHTHTHTHARTHAHLR